jgi:hypothetical protein
MPKLYRTRIASEAELKVFVTDVRSEADLVVYETQSQWEATEGPIWWYTDIQSEAEKTVCFSASQWDADIVIHTTDIQSDAGWVNSSKTGLL